MAGKGIKSLSEAMRGLALAAQPCRAVAAQIRPSFSTCTRSMATEAPAIALSAQHEESYRPLETVPVTIYSFPSLEPRALEVWSTKHLHLPLRRDLLHLAVIYEGDKTRQGTASTKTRYDVHGSHKKMAPQKGTGRARRGTRQSPIFRGGGKTFGPHPRDFSTRINRKVYDLAWRTALSYRYRRGELVVTEDGLDLPFPDDFLALAERSVLTRELEDGFVRKYISDMLGVLQWDKAFGRTTFVTTERRPNLFTSFEVAGDMGRALELEDVDVKDLLETGRIVIERSALKEMIKKHQSDLVSRIFIDGVRQTGPNLGRRVINP